VRSALLATVTAALFALTRNFWLCLVCSLIVEISIARWFPAQETL
jgi:accessory gene regulator protein AgrB